MCNNCIHKTVCGKFAATGGQVNNCEHRLEDRRGSIAERTERTAEINHSLGMLKGIAIASDPPVKKAMLFAIDSIQDKIKEIGACLNF